MNFTRKALTLALAGMVGAGLTGSVLADDALQQGLTPNATPKAYASPDGASSATGSHAATSSESRPSSESTPGSDSTMSSQGVTGSQATMGGQGATADQAQRATSSANAPADRLPANRGQAGESASKSGNPNALYEGNEDAKAVTKEMSGRYNGSDLNAAPDAGNLPQGHPPVEVYRRSTTLYVVPGQPGQSTTSGTAADARSSMDSQSRATSPSSTDAQSMDSQSTTSRSSTDGSRSTDQRFDALTGSGTSGTGAMSGSAGNPRNDASGSASERSSNLKDHSTGSNANGSSRWSSPASAESSGTPGNP
jgi:hypothetical protein